MKKLGVIVPYRNRHLHLTEFKKQIVSYLDSNSYENYVIIIVEQDDARLFNRGMLLNIGFKEAEKQDCDYVVFHDVDMLPIYVNYSYLTLANYFQCYKHTMVLYYLMDLVDHYSNLNF